MILSLPDEILAPLKSSDLMQAYRERTRLLIKGTRGKLSAVFNWDDLNRALEMQRLPEPRLRLFKGGKQVPSNLYSRDVRLPLGDITTRLLADEIASLMAEGSTMVLRGIDELNPTVRNLTEALEVMFEARVQVNMYAAWQREDSALDTHTDNHDVIILQTCGRKRWRLFGMAKHYQDPTASNKPPAAPEEDIILEQGDVLYLPRGWWHHVQPLDEPTMHLTVGIYHPTGMDLIQGALVRLRKNPFLIGSAPKRPDDGSAAYLDEVRKIISGDINPDLLDDLASIYQKHFPRRPRFHLPKSGPS